MKVIIFSLCSQRTNKGKASLSKEEGLEWFRILPVTVCSSGGSSRLGISVGSVTTLETHRNTDYIRTNVNSTV